MKKMFSMIFLIFALFVTVHAAEGDYIIRYRADAPVVMTYSGSDYDLGAGMMLVSAEKALALQEAGYLEICEPDRIMTYYDNPSDTYYSNQWNLPVIKASYPWSLNTFGNEVLVGVIDSGLAADHPDIDYSRVIEGYNFGSIPSDEDYNTNRLDTTDTSGHGTMVSGVIVAKRNNSLGLSGIADKVKLVPMKVENKKGSIYSSSVINAINAGVGFGCDVINISLGMGTSSADLDAAIKNAYDKGCIVICAAGNDTPSDPGDHIRYPAGCEGAISVGSTTKTNTRAESSVVNESLFISAPADGIPLLYYTGNYATAGGTSFAAPQVAAAAAIAKSINPDLTPAEFADILKNTVTDLGTDGRDTEFGYGLLDIEAMVKYMINGSDVYVSPFDDSTASVTLYNLSDGEITLSSFFAGYSNKGKMVVYGPVTQPTVTLPAGGYVTRTFGGNLPSGRLRHFLWQSYVSAHPYSSFKYTRELFK